MLGIHALSLCIEFTLKAPEPSLKEKNSVTIFFNAVEVLFLKNTVIRCKETTSKAVFSQEMFQSVSVCHKAFTTGRTTKQSTK